MSEFTSELQHKFRVDGYVVIENILSPDEITLARNNLHNELLNYGVNHENILNGIDEPPDSVRKKSDISNMHYCKWKLDLQLNQDIYNIYEQANSVIEETYYPLGKSSFMLPFIDRICYRLPDVIRQEGGLQLHLDRRPPSTRGDLRCFDGTKKYRPIQGFITLTDHYGNSSGGLKVVKGFHNEFENYFDGHECTDKSGEFYRMHNKAHAKLQAQCKAIPAPAGSLVIWDSRLPHSTCDTLSGYDSREVIYMSYLPNIDVNKKYWINQRNNFINNIVPHAAASVKNSDYTKIDRTYSTEELSDYQKMLLGL